MTKLEYDAIVRYCRRMWVSEKRGALTDFDEFVGRVMLEVVEDARPLGRITLAVLTDMRREMQRESQAIAHIAFESQRPATHDTLPAAFEVPHEKRGGKREGAGRKRK